MKTTVQVYLLKGTLDLMAFMLMFACLYTQYNGVYPLWYFISIILSFCVFIITIRVYGKAIVYVGVEENLTDALNGGFSLRQFIKRFGLFCGAEAISASVYMSDKPQWEVPTVFVVLVLLGHFLINTAIKECIKNIK